jgi:molybdopterin-biosynthesis enzyme MoeA-like protein
MPESNRKQAMLPQGADRIDNEWGTAPGFSLHYGRCWFAFLPGVPMEMKHLFEERILPTLSTRFLLRPGQLITIKTLGLGESAIQECINSIDIPVQVQLGFRAGADEVQTKLLFPFDYPQMAMSTLVAKFAQQLGDHVFAIDGLGEITGDLVFEIDKLMTSRKLTLAVVETVSQGLLAAKCVGSEWLISAIFEQSIARSGQNLIAETDTESLMKSAKALALDTQQTSRTDFVLVQLYTGDNKTLHDKYKPIVLYNTLLAGDTFHQATHSIAGPIKRKQNQAALLTLDLLRRYLQHKEISH